MAEAYNASLLDLYQTSKHEDAEISEDQLVSIAFQVLKALAFLNQHGLCLQGQLRMDSIYFTEQGRVKLSDMAPVLLGTFKPFRSPLYTAPGTGGDDVWTLGVILLLCMSQSLDLESLGELHHG